MSAAVETLLSRLNRVKPTGPGKWIASCPTREDKSPSLSIRELEDGRVLLHDFGGEATDTILAAVGLSFCDLFPKAVGNSGKPINRPFNASDVVRLVAFESAICAIAIYDFLRLGSISHGDSQRLMVAAQRLGDAAEVCS
jgi:hypothetical protein